jgi:hypothetical protein
LGSRLGAKDLEGDLFCNSQAGRRFNSKAVMTGLVPVIHVGARSALRKFAAPVPPGPIALLPDANSLDVDVDGRDKPGHDVEGAAFDPPPWELLYLLFSPCKPLKSRKAAKEILGEIWRFQEYPWKKFGKSSRPARRPAKRKR